MNGSEKHTPGGLPPTQELTCTVCGGKFLFRGIERQRFARWGWQPPKRCPLCRQAEKERQQQEAERLEREEWQRRTAQEKSQFETELASWNVVPVENVVPRSDRVLYILGNGFDLMHRVRSSYYAFRDTLGKNSNLRQSLENYLTPADIWRILRAPWPIWTCGPWPACPGWIVALMWRGSTKRTPAPLRIAAAWIWRSNR